MATSPKTETSQTKTRENEVVQIESTSISTTTIDSTNKNDGPASSVVAGLTRSFLLAAKSLPKGMIQATLKKRAFMTIGQRTVATTIARESVPAGNPARLSHGISGTWPR
jgi:hypothetical protein